MKLTFGSATAADATALAALRTAVAEDLTARYGRGHWSSAVTERSVLRGVERAVVIVARYQGEMVGVLQLATRKPWAIDPACFQVVSRPLYLTDMAVLPAAQRKGVGAQLLGRAVAAARQWPAEAIRLDAYDADAGAGEFYRRHGFREVGRVTYRGTPLRYFEMLL